MLGSTKNMDPQKRYFKLKSDVPIPDVNDDQLLIEVVAAALNPADFKRMFGFFKDTDSTPTVSMLNYLSLFLACLLIQRVLSTSHTRIKNIFTDMSRSPNTF